MNVPRKLGDPADILISMVGLSNGTLVLVDTIEHEGQLWLVPNWIEDIHAKRMQPRRIISLSGIRYQRGNFGNHQVVVNEGLPADLESLNPPAETAKRTRVIESPEIFYAVPTEH